MIYEKVMSWVGFLLTLFWSIVAFGSILGGSVLDSFGILGLIVLLSIPLGFALLTIIAFKTAYRGEDK